MATIKYRKYYDTCYKCGKSKKRTTHNRCNDCKKVYYYDVCLKCKSPKNRNKSGYCSKCSYQSDKHKRPTKAQKKEIKEFVDRIRSRNGMASTYEVFVELIGFYNIIKKRSDLIDDHDLNGQIELMWQRLNEYVDKL